MSTVIYYFTGTGNSLAVAKDIAEKTNGKLIPISSVINEETVRLRAEAIGIVFPVYYATNDYGIPLIVSRFVSKLENIKSKYIFAVCTCGGMPGSTIENLRKEIDERGGKLAAGFTVKMSNKNLSQKEQQKILIKRKKKMIIICNYVNARKEGKFETRSWWRKILLAPLRLIEKPIFMHRYKKLSNASNLPFRKLVPLADKSFRVNENCNGCGVCAKVCPVNNIEIVDGKPVWQHRCETCYACYGWCPNEAIYGDIVAYNERYHNPEIKLSDILN